MHVKELSRTVAVLSRPDEPLIDVANRMRFNDTGASVVMFEGDVAGLITERELVQAIADGADLVRTKVAQYMISEPVVVAPEVDTIVAATIMARRDLAHLAVVDHGMLAGIVSQRSLVAELLETHVVAAD